MSVFTRVHVCTEISIMCTFVHTPQAAAGLVAAGCLRGNQAPVLFTVFRCAPFPRKCLHTLLVFTRVHADTEFVYKCTHDTASVCS